VTWRPRVQRVAEHWIRRACGRLPEGGREERYREWVAELSAILADPEVRGVALRHVRALRYAAGVHRGARRLGRAAGWRRGSVSGGWASRSARRPLQRPRLPDGIVTGLASVSMWLCAILLIKAIPPHGTPDYPALAISAFAEALAVVAVVRFIRWLRRKPRQSPPR
jgi:hypothetical protein